MSIILFNYFFTNIREGRFRQMKIFFVIGSLNDGEDGRVVRKLIFAAVDLVADASVDFRKSRP